MTMARTSSKGGSSQRARPEPGRSSRKGRQAAALRARRRTRTGAIGVVAVVLVVVLVMVVLALTRHPGTAQGSGTAGEAGNLAQHVPVSVLDQVGAGKAITPPKALPSGTPALEQDGKPQILYIGAEYCPYCATERWPLVVALSRFGSFTNLGGTESAPAPEVFPQTPTFTFHGATYVSDVLSFAGVETNTNQRDPSGGGYTALDQATAAQQALVQQFDVNPYSTNPGAIPFLLIGNRFVSVGASYDPSVLEGLTRDQIARALSDPTSPVAQSVDGAANVLTAAICQATGGAPSSVCASPVIAQIMSGLPSGS
jgi:hypothetical protein